MVFYLIQSLTFAHHLSSVASAKTILSFWFFCEGLVAALLLVALAKLWINFVCVCVVIFCGWSEHRTPSVGTILAFPQNVLPF